MLQFDEIIKKREEYISDIYKAVYECYYKVIDKYLSTDEVLIQIINGEVIKLPKEVEDEIRNDIQKKSIQCINRGCSADVFKNIERSAIQKFTYDMSNFGWKYENFQLTAIKKD